MPVSAFAGRVLALLVLCASAAACSGDGLVTAEAGAAGIVVTTKPGVDAFAVQADYFSLDEDAEPTGLVTGVVVDGQIVMAFSGDATGSQVGQVALRLGRDERIAGILVSVLDERGESVVRP